MKKKNVVKSKILFNDIIQIGKRNANKYFVICSVSKNEITNNFGIAVGKKIGNAVVRNKIKRQIRNIIDNNYKLFPKFHNYIIICKKDILNLSFWEMESELIKLLNKGEENEK
ncbi:MAG: ribonuclease P protein component [Firmicutes bacterium]|nr:ribonuclease P protein component [Bacillota bacterium]